MKTRTLSAIVSAMALWVAPFAQAAADLYWSGNGSTLGGAGTWDTSNGRWGTSAAGPFSTVWNNFNNDTAVFYGTGATVTLTDNITVGGLTFNKVNAGSPGATTYYTLAAAAKTLSFASGDNTLLFAIGNGGAPSATITGQVAGSGANVIVSAQSFVFSGNGVPGTLTFNGASTGGWSGTTTINWGMTLTTTTTSGNINQVLNSTSGITINGGTIQFNRATNAQLNSISDLATITVNGGGTFSATSADAGGGNAIESIGSVTVNSGQMNFNWTNGGSSGTLMTLTSLSRSGTASANFNSGFASNNSRWKVTGAGTTTAGEILGPWYTTGGNNAGFASTDYAVYSSDFVAQANITANNTETTWASTSNITLTATATTLTGTRTLNSLRYNAAVGSLALGASTYNLETYGILNGGSGLLTISTTGTGYLTTPNTGSGTTNNLFLTTGSNAITVSAPIKNNTSVVTLVKSGGNTLTLSGNNTFTGGLVLNAGTLRLSGTQSFTGGVTLSGGAFGDSTDSISAAELGSNSVTVNGNASMYITSGETLAGAIAISSTGNLKLNGPTSTLGGVVSGSGVLTITSLSSATVTLTNTANTHTGVISIVNDNNQNINLAVNSLADSASPGAGNIQMGGGATICNYSFALHSGAIAPLILNNRQVELVGDGPSATYPFKLSNNSTQAFTINSNLRASGSNVKTLTLGGTGAGLSTFAGAIANGGLTTLNLTKADANSTWVLSGTNTYNGATTLSAGTLVISGINTGSGATTVSAGKLVGVVGGSCSNSAVTVSAGTLSVSVTDTNLNWTCKSLTHSAAATMEFAFGGTTPSASVAPLQVNGNVVFAVAPTVSCTGSSLPAGTYPLIKWTGAFSGVAPSSLTLPSGTGILVFDAANKTIWLSISAAGGSKQPLTWKGPAGSTWVANGTVYTNWQDASTPTPVNTNYQETTVSEITVGDSVVFGNTGAGTVILDTTVSPAAVSVNANTPNNYTISGLGSIAGGGGLTKTGTGSLRLSTPNSYAGGTLLSAGTLIIDNASALGTGPLVLGGGTIQNIDATARTIDNTVVFNGSTAIGGTGNFNFTSIGTGTVVTASTLTVTNSNVNATFATALSGAGSITKAGAGTMTLTGTNTYSGSTTVSAGALTVNGGMLANNVGVTLNGTLPTLMTVVNGGIVTNVSGTVSIGTAGNPFRSGNSLTISNGARWYGGSVAVGQWTSNNGDGATNNSYNVGGLGSSSTVSNSAITVGYINGSPSGLSYASGNSMTVTNATLLVGGTLSIGLGGGNGGQANNNSVQVLNGGTINVLGGNAINVGNNASQGPRFNSLVITNGGYVSGGLLTLAGTGPSNSVQVLNGGQLVTVGATIGGGNFAQLTGGGSGGSTSTWNVVGGNILFNGTSGTLTVDGAGMAGGAVATNVNQLQIGYTGGGSANNSVVLTNGARMFSTNTISVGYTDAGSTGTTSGNTLMIAGGAASSVLNVGGATLQVAVIGTGNNGNTPTVRYNQAVIGTGGILTNVGSVYIGYNSVVGLYGTTAAYVTNNQMTVTGGQLYSSGTSYIGYAANAGGLSPINSYNSATIAGVNSLWDLGGATLYVGYSTKSTATVRNNSLTVGSGGVLTNAGRIAVGLFSSGICQSNTVTVSNANVSATILTVASNNTLSLDPGGQIYANAVTNSGTLAVTIAVSQTPACGCLNVASNLNVNTSSLNISATGKPVGVFVIASYKTLAGVFAATNGLPDNCTLYMDYLGSKQIAIVGTSKGTLIQLY